MAINYNVLADTCAIKWINTSSQRSNGRLNRLLTVDGSCQEFEFLIFSHLLKNANERGFGGPKIEKIFQKTNPHSKNSQGRNFKSCIASISM